ncbi:MAG: hypothetical protein ABUS57_03350 [Pseudomonadota bacterium]
MAIRIALAAFALALSQPCCALGCTLVGYADDGRYIGGDLVAQIVRKADTIQIVRATGRHLVRRTYSDGMWYWRFGQTDVPAAQPDYTDEFVYELTVVETLKGGLDAAQDYYEQHPRAYAYGRQDLIESYRAKNPDFPEPTEHANALPAWAMASPGHDHYAFSGGAAEGAALGLGECRHGYILDVGDTFIALRDNMGRLYPPGGAFPLAVDTEFRLPNGHRDRGAFNLQSLIPISSDSDPLLVSLRQALAR